MAISKMEGYFRGSHLTCSIKKGVLENFTKFTGTLLCQSLFFNKVAGLTLETLAQVFSCEFCEIFKNTFFTEHLRTTTSIILKILSHVFLEELMFFLFTPTKKRFPMLIQKPTHILL